MWEWGALSPVISAQECEFSVPILLRSAFLYKIYVPAPVPKMPGTRERETKNAGPSLIASFYDRGWLIVMSVMYSHYPLSELDARLQNNVASRACASFSNVVALSRIFHLKKFVS